MLMALKGQRFGQMPHPMHKLSEIKAILESGETSIQSFPLRTTGHDFLHSCLHFLGLHLSEEIMAILVSLSLIVAVFSSKNFPEMNNTVQISLLDLKIRKFSAVLEDHRPQI